MGSLPQLIILLGHYVHAVKHVRKYCPRPPKNASYYNSRAVNVELEEEISDVIGRGLRTVQSYCIDTERNGKSSLNDPS